MESRMVMPVVRQLVEHVEAQGATPDQEAMFHAVPLQCLTVENRVIQVLPLV